jgi:hypothetical protein
MVDYEEALEERTTSIGFREGFLAFVNRFTTRFV